MEIKQRFYLLFLMLISNILFVKAQELFGDWVELQNKAYSTIPISNIMSISTDKITYFDFEKVVLEKETSSLIKYESGNYVTDHDYYAFINPNKLIIKAYYENSDVTDKKKYLIERIYFRLKPTNILGSIEAIKNTGYKINDGLVTSKIAFGEYFPDTSVFRYGQNIIGNRLELEKWGSTYFISVYIENDRVNIVPIKEMSCDYLVIYGIDENDEIIVLRD